MDQPTFRKPRQYFDTTTRPVHVTFDDGRAQRRNFPWMHYVEARWEYFDQGAINVFIGDLLVVIVGSNLGPLFTAIEEQTLVRIRAQPDLAKDREHDPDSFATDIRFFNTQDAPEANGQFELNLGSD